MTSPYSSSWPSSSSVIPAALGQLRAGEDHLGLRQPVDVGRGVVPNRLGHRPGIRLRRPARRLEQGLGRRRFGAALLRLGLPDSVSGSATLRPAVPGGRRSPRGTAVHLRQALLDHLERQEVLALLAQDEAQTFDVGRIELAVSRRCPLRVDQALALEEADLRDRDVFELRAELIEHVADRDVLDGGHVSRPDARRRGRS